MTTAYAAAPAARPSAFAAFREGFAVPMDGFRHMSRHPGLWRYAVIPILLNLLITALVVLGLVGAAVWFAVKLHPRFSDEWWGVLLEVLVAVALLAVALALALGTWLLLNGVLCGYFYTKLARQVELQLGTRPEDLRDVPFRDQVVDTLRTFAALLGINVGLLLLHVVPVVGSVVAVVLTLYFDSFLFGLDYLDFPLSLRGLRRADKLAIARAHRWHTVGLGAAVLLMNFVPVVGSIALATAAAGSVLLYRRWREKDLTRD